MRLAVLFAVLTACGAANILALLPMAAPSHTGFVRPLLHALATRGHNVTVLSPFSINHPNITDITIEDAHDQFLRIYKLETMIRGNVVTSLLANKVARDFIHQVAAFSMASNGIRHLMNSTDHFDLIMTDFSLQECFLGFVHKFHYPPVIGIVPYVTNPWTRTLSNTDNPVYMPHLLMPASEKMGLWLRCINTLLHAYSYFDFHYVMLPHMDRLAKKYFGDETPELDSILNNISLTFVNRVVGVDYGRPQIPHIISVGGLHLLPPKPLPQIYQKLLDSATAGAIYFSLGSILHVSNLPSDFVDELMSAFRRLPFTVLWRWEGEGTPPVQLAPNVWRASWMPQADILAHPNIKCFISHGGQNSFIEGVSNGVPMVMMPLIGDQLYNAERAVYRGMGVKLSIMHVTADELVEAVLKVTQDPSYRASAVRLSGIMSETMLPPLDRAVYWTEHVLRHKGARHLHTQGASWFPQLLLVGAVFLLVMIAVLLLVVKTIVIAIKAGFKYKRD